MTLAKFRTSLPIIATLLISLFFVLVLHFKISYSLIPILLSVIGIGLLYPDLKRKRFQLSRQDKWLVGAVLFYFLLFVLSLIIHKGKANELDIPSRALLLLPLLAVCYRLPLKGIWILYSLVIATLIAAVVGFIQFFWLKLPHLFPAHMYIQAGDILMTLSLLSFTAAFYFKQHKATKWFALALSATGLGILACLLNQARGAWVAAPIVILMLFIFNRHILSKTMLIALAITAVAGTFFAGNQVQKRWNLAERDVKLYFEKNNGSTSVGARLDMWKSAWLGIQEKPILGWGLQGVKQMRLEHHKQKKISKFASKFDHAHNQYLQDTSARGILGLTGLLGLFLVPFALFWQNNRQLEKNSLAHFWGICGITHITATMLYCLSQSFLSHNSGIMFYCFLTLIFYGLQKNAQNQPLGEKA